MLLGYKIQENRQIFKLKKAQKHVFNLVFKNVYILSFQNSVHNLCSLQCNLKKIEFHTIPWHFKVLLLISIVYTDLLYRIFGDRFSSEQLLYLISLKLRLFSIFQIFKVPFFKILRSIYQLQKAILILM